MAVIARDIVLASNTTREWDLATLFEEYIHFYQGMFIFDHTFFIQTHNLPFRRVSFMEEEGESEKEMMEREWRKVEDSFLSVQLHRTCFHL
jgi:hypothetical protein